MFMPRELLELRRPESIGRVTMQQACIFFPCSGSAPRSSTSPVSMGSKPSETGADPGATPGELEDGAGRGGSFRLE